MGPCSIATSWLISARFHSEFREKFVDKPWQNVRGPGRLHAALAKLVEDHLRELALLEVHEGRVLLLELQGWCVTPWLV